MRFYITSLAIALVFILSLLFNSLTGCKPTDPVGPGKPNSGTPVSHTPTSSTPVTSTGTSVSSVTVVNDPYPLKPDYTVPLPAENRLVKVIYKDIVNAYTKPIIDSEEVSIGGGKTIQVSLRYTTVYKYDVQGRLLNEFKIDVIRQDTTSITYIYEKDKIYKIQNGSRVNSKPYISRDTLLLDGRGLAIVQEEKRRVRFDSDGFEIGSTTRSGQLRTITISNNNPIRYWGEIGGEIGNEILKIFYAADLKNLQPTLYPFRGSTSQNLRTHLVIAYERSLIVANTDNYQFTYYYLFDRYGRIKKQIRTDKKLHPGWNLVSDGEGVYYYEYSVP
jgi:hypothetical protein